MFSSGSRALRHTLNVQAPHPAKNICALHGIDQNGRAVLVKPGVPRGQLAALIAQLPPSLIGMEACAALGKALSKHGQPLAERFCGEL